MSAEMDQSIALDEGGKSIEESQASSSTKNKKLRKKMIKNSREADMRKAKRTLDKINKIAEYEDGFDELLESMLLHLSRRLSVLQNLHSEILYLQNNGVL